MKKNKGFTLIELLVVIAIIGILASVVLAALSSARSKGQDAAVQTQLANMRAQAELFYGADNNSYGTAGSTCTTAGSLFDANASGAMTGLSLANLINGISTAKDCGNTTSAWSVAAQGATSGLFFCVDSTGVSRSKLNGTTTAYTALTGSATAAHTAAGATVCN